MAEINSCVMRKISKLSIIGLALLVTGAVNTGLYAQSSLQDLEPEAYFDFWLGEWELSWENPDGTIAEGTNRIERILDGKVIRENFEALSGNMEEFAGKSYSVYNSRTGEWKQTWVDNEGGYLDFTGKFGGDKRIFERKTHNREGEEIIQRMVFHNITDEALTWDWEFSDDGGENWQLQWKIFYKRKK